MLYSPEDRANSDRAIAAGFVVFYIPNAMPDADGNDDNRGRFHVGRAAKLVPGLREDGYSTRNDAWNAAAALAS